MGGRAARPATRRPPARGRLRTRRGDRRGRATRGSTVVGVDRSAVMVGQARRRNRRAVRAGRVELVTAPGRRPARLRRALRQGARGEHRRPLGRSGRRTHCLRRVLRSGGRIAVVTQPRSAGATAADSRAAADATAGSSATAGFDDVRIETLDARPASGLRARRQPMTGSPARFSRSTTRGTRRRARSGGSVCGTRRRWRSGKPTPQARARRDACFGTRRGRRASRPR